MPGRGLLGSRRLLRVLAALWGLGIAGIDLRRNGKEYWLAA